MYGFEDILTKRKIKRLKKELEDSYIELSKVRCMAEESVMDIYNCESKQEIINIILEEIKMIKEQIEEEKIWEIYFLEQKILMENGYMEE